MPEITTLSAELRARAGKGAARATRRAGRVPGIVYGGNQEPAPISLEPARIVARARQARLFRHARRCAASTARRNARCRAKCSTIRSPTRRCMSISCGSAPAPG